MNTTTDSVRLALFDVDDPTYFLVLAEADDPTNWKLAGGKFNNNAETPEEAMDREFSEELGLRAVTAKIRRASMLTNDDGTSERHIFVGQISRDQIIPSDEIEAVQWVTAQTVPDGPNKAHIISAIQSAREAFQEQS